MRGLGSVVRCINPGLLVAKGSRTFAAKLSWHFRGTMPPRPARLGAEDQKLSEEPNVNYSRANDSMMASRALRIGQLL